ncbi:hypothetical protein F0231_02315 [Vibrio sp. RE86]|uniref:hypothetical protein n=1 Tax=Vibrio sp. RE86 TaxID=2607605 RepID=UPI001493BD7B|nr:hypothetical protein [Vibrio sp. RE86]NOH78570.1 hypothetical protein [Vibrio sp. RE86]
MILPSDLKKVGTIMTSLIKIVKKHGVELNRESAYYISKTFKEKVIPCSRNVHYYLTLNNDAGETLITKIVHANNTVDIGFKDIYGNKLCNATITDHGELKEYRL